MHKKYTDPVSADSRMSGFSLLELMVVLAIIGIAAAIAIPSFRGFVTESRRSDAISFLNELAGEQQRYFSKYNVFADSMGELGYSPVRGRTFTSPEGHYRIEIKLSDNASRYELSAIPVSGGAQEEDRECAAFVLGSTGLRLNKGGTSEKCW